MRSLLILSLSLLLACQMDRNKKIDRDKFTFKTGDDTELFFKNIRQSYYDLEENKAAGLNVFRIRSRQQIDSLPVLHLAIVINYLQDEAYILLEPNAALQDHIPLTVLWQDPKDGKTGEYKIEVMNRENMLEFSSQLYEGITANYQLSLGSGTPFLANVQHREAFRVTMSDYYRLTRVF